MAEQLHFWPDIKARLILGQADFKVECSSCTRELKLTTIEYRSHFQSPEPAYMVPCGHIYCKTCLEPPGCQPDEIVRFCSRCELNLVCRVCRGVEKSQLPFGFASETCNYRAVPLCWPDIGVIDRTCIDCMKRKDKVAHAMRARGLPENENQVALGATTLVEESWPRLDDLERFEQYVSQRWAEARAALQG